MTRLKKMKKIIIHRPKKGDYYISICGLDLHHSYWATEKRNVTCRKCRLKKPGGAK